MGRTSEHQESLKVLKSRVATRESRQRYACYSVSGMPTEDSQFAFFRVSLFRPVSSGGQECTRGCLVEQSLEPALWNLVLGCYRYLSALCGGC
jgi:hypothetical protein